MKKKKKLKKKKKSKKKNGYRSVKNETKKSVKSSIDSKYKSQCKSLKMKVKTKKNIKSKITKSFIYLISEKNEENYMFYMFENLTFKDNLIIIVMMEKNTLQSNFLYLYDKQFDKNENTKLKDLFNRTKNGIEQFSNICAQLNGFYKIKGKLFIFHNE